PQNDVTLKMPAFEWVHVQLHQQKGMISLSPPTICNSAVCADDGYTGVEKRSEHADREVIWQVAARRSTYKMLDKRSALYKAKRKIEKAKAQVRAKVEPPFRVIKRQFGYTKVRFRGLVKNTAQLVTLFALSNLWMARRHLLASAGEVRL
ncbi:transposase, partial [Enterobacter asburiae]|uniref:transposase n=1 Tax=Enterobacter asburiae TaxID=61645 RepID=UPI0020053283